MMLLNFIAPAEVLELLSNEMLTVPKAGPESTPKAALLGVTLNAPSVPVSFSEQTAWSGLLQEPLRCRRW